MGVRFFSLRADLFEILQGRFGYSLQFIYIFNHFFLSVWTHEYLFHILSYNPMLLYVFCCSICSSVGHSEPFCLSPVSFDTGILNISYTSLLFDNIKCFKFFLYISFPLLESAISQKALAPFWRNGIRNHSGCLLLLRCHFS